MSKYGIYIFLPQFKYWTLQNDFSSSLVQGYFMVLLVIVNRLMWWRVCFKMFIIFHAIEVAER